MTKHDHIETLLGGLGTDPAVIDAVKRVDAVFQRWRRQMTKRELGRLAIEKLNLPIDLSQLDVLFAIAAPAHEFDAPGDAETMVATVAERLSIDPSRASRIVSDMVSAGYARRAVSQADARRTIVELTDAGWAMVRAVQSYKWMLLSEFFAGWTREDIATFVPLLERHSNWLQDARSAESIFAADIEALSAKLAEALEMSRTSGRKSG